MRWSTADSRLGAKTTQSARPAIVPTNAATVPTTAPLARSTRRTVLLRGADRSQHSELSEPSLRDDGEACGGDERRKEEEDGSDGEDGQRLGRTTDVVSASLGAGEGRAGAVAEG